MKTIFTIIAGLLFIVLIGMWLENRQLKQDMNNAYWLGRSEAKPRDILGFAPCDINSPSFITRPAQGELSRLGYSVGIKGCDGKCGKDTALALCEYLVDLDKR